MLWKDKIRFFSKVFIYNLFSINFFAYFYYLYFLLTYNKRERSKNYIDLSIYINKKFIFPEIEKISKNEITLLDIGCGPDIFNNVNIFSKYQNKIKQSCTDKFSRLNKNIFKNSFKYFFNNNAKFEIDNFFKINKYEQLNLVKNKLYNNYDVIICTWVLPHLNINEINNLLKNIKNKSRIYIFLIDFTDLYFHELWNMDHNENRFNFLKYSTFKWSLINNKFHYQNRMRFNDYENIFIDNGYKIKFKQRCNQLMEPINDFDNNLKLYINNQKLNSHFSKYKNLDLFTSKGIFILEKLNA